MHKSKINLSDIILLVLTFAISAGYFFLNKPAERLHIIATRFDSAIPLIPVFSIPYLLFLPLLVAVIFYAFFNQKKFRELMFTIIVVWLISDLFFIFYQTQVVRPEIIGSGFFNNLIRLIYSHDAPYNAFPSTHTSLSTVIALYFISIKNKWSILFIIFSVLIILSTLFTKQHYVLDVAGGLVLAIATFFLFFKSDRKH